MVLVQRIIKRAEDRPTKEKAGKGSNLKKRMALASGALAPEVIEHPDLLTWWGISILVAVLAVLIVRRQSWMRPLLLGFAAVFFALIAFYVLSFVVSERPRDVNFINEAGWGYFIQLLIIAYLPWGAIRHLGKVSKPAQARQPSPRGEIGRVGN